MASARDVFPEFFVELVEAFSRPELADRIPALEVVAHPGARHGSTRAVPM